MKHLLPAVQRTALRIPWAAVGGCAAALLLTAAASGGQYAPFYIFRRVNDCHTWDSTH